MDKILRRTKEYLKILYSHRFDYQKVLYRSLLALFFLIIPYKIYACFQVPLGTTDVLRNLGYASHAMEHNFNIYNTKGTDFSPEIWTLLPWSEVTFQYPPATLIFFHIFSIFGLGIFWVKLTLTLIEFACSYLFYKRISKVAALLFFCAPFSLLYTSYEGQFEALLTLFIILNALAVKDKHWFIAGFWFAISIQVKQFAILIAPWIFYQIWRERSSDFFPSILGKVTLGTVLGFLPFLGYYLQKPDLLLIPFLTMSNLTNNNLFAWNFLSHQFSFAPLRQKLWYSLWTYVPLNILLFVIIFARKKVETLFSFIPLSSFFFVIKSIKVARYWYLIFHPAFLFHFSQRKTLICILLVVYFIETLFYTIQGVVLGLPIDWPHSPKEFSIMKSCMFTCNSHSPT